MNSSNFLIKASSCNADNTCSRLFFCHPTCFGSNICKRKKWRGLEKRFFYFWNFRFWSFVSKWRHFSPNISSHSLSRQSQSVSWSIAREQHPTSLYKKSSQQDTCNSSSSKSYYSFGRDTSRRRGRRKTSPQNNPTKTSLSTGNEFNVHKIVQPSIFGWTSSLFCQSVTAQKSRSCDCWLKSAEFNLCQLTHSFPLHHYSQIVWNYRELWYIYITVSIRQKKS